MRLHAFSRAQPTERITCSSCDSAVQAVRELVKFKGPLSTKAAVRFRPMRTLPVRPDLSYCRSMPYPWRIATLRAVTGFADSPTVALLPLQGVRLRQLRLRITNVPYASPTSGSRATKSVTPTSIPACESSVVA
jgi:hypothetical protein